MKREDPQTNRQTPTPQSTTRTSPRARGKTPQAGRDGRCAEPVGARGHPRTCLLGAVWWVGGWKRKGRDWYWRGHVRDSVVALSPPRVSDFSSIPAPSLTPYWPADQQTSCDRPSLPLLFPALALIFVSLFPKMRHGSPPLDRPMSPSPQGHMTIASIAACFL